MDFQLAKKTMRRYISVRLSLSYTYRQTPFLHKKL